MTNLKKAKRLYTPGTAFKSAYSGDEFIIPDEPKITQRDDECVFVEIDRKNIFILYQGKWAEILCQPIQTVDRVRWTGSGWSDAKDSVNDNKLIRRFETGAVRSDSTGRPRPDWVSPYAIEAISMRMVGAQNDFGEANYLLGIPELKCLESLVRHVEELKEALLIEKDPVKAKDIASAVGFNVTAMLHTMVLKEKGLYKKVYNKEEELVTVEEAKKGANFTDKK